jgi:hypothetical protein
MPATRNPFRLFILLSTALLLTLTASAASTGRTLASNGTVVTKLRANGLAANVILEDSATGTNGFVSVAQDEIANTVALDFSYAYPDTANPGFYYVFQGAGEIPNTALEISRTFAHLAVTTPDSYAVYRCYLNTVTGDYFCDVIDPISFDLTWVVTGIGTIRESTKRFETFGPVTTKFQAEFIARTALVNGTYGGITGVGMSGNVYDTDHKSYIREITLKP